MVRRIVSGNLGGGAYGLRVSRPGYDVLTEPVGSANIALDTRDTDIGTVIASGLIACGAGPVSFPGGALPYVPIAQIFRWDGTNLFDYVYIDGGTGKPHFWLPAYAVLTTSSIEVKAFTVPWYTTTTTFNPAGVYYNYYVFASG